MKEFERRSEECTLCKQAAECTYYKAAHVPLYAWVCDPCAAKWVRE